MRCQWTQFLEILPIHLRNEVDQIGRDTLDEIRLRINAPPELRLKTQSIWLQRAVSKEDLDFVVNSASRYSPWCMSTVVQGYLTAPGGHRIGFCGEAIFREGILRGIRTIQSLCIRVARDYSGLITKPSELSGSVLILGAPGWGKTTLLRDLARQISATQTVAVVDERGELFPEGFSKGKRMDVLSACPKTIGIEMLLRTMNPETIVVDEITAPEDCDSLIQAANCGVRLIAAAHAASKEDFFRRKIYRPLIEEKIMDTLLILRRDKSWFPERMAI